LQRSAILALCKVICLTAKLCTAHVPLIFALLQRPSLDPVTKCSLVIATADLYQRHTNIVEDRNITKLFPLMRQSKGELGHYESRVRKQALLVIIHIVLNQLLRIQGEIVDILMILLDKDEGMKNQVDLFLEELNLKDENKLWNLF